MSSHREVSAAVLVRVGRRTKGAKRSKGADGKPGTYVNSSDDSGADPGDEERSADVDDPVEGPPGEDDCRSHTLLCQPDFEESQGPGQMNVAVASGLSRKNVHRPSGSLHIAMEASPGRRASVEAKVRAAVLSGAQAFAGHVEKPAAALDQLIKDLQVVQTALKDAKARARRG